MNVEPTRDGKTVPARSVPETLTEALLDAYAIIEEAMAEHGPIERTFLLLSGGNDSMVLLDTCATWADDIVHINTGIGIEETTEFVRQVVADRGDVLTELHPPIPYEELVLGRWQGFPGPGAHRFTYTMLKERCVEALLRAHRTKRGQRFMLLTGARAGESQRRMGNAEAIRREGGQVWVNPLVNWSNDLMRLYRGVYGLPENEVTKHLHMSGECLCGAFAKPGEIDMIGLFYPAFVERVRSLEAKAREAGLKRCVWGERPPRKGDAAPGPMCHQCTLWDDTEGADTVVTVGAPTAPNGRTYRQENQ